MGEFLVGAGMLAAGKFFAECDSLGVDRAAGAGAGSGFLDGAGFRDTGAGVLGLVFLAMGEFQGN
jgi:hypothetical protein